MPPKPGYKWTHKRKAAYDAYVLYKGDKVVGVFDTLDSIAEATGFKRDSVRIWSLPCYRRDADAGVLGSNCYLVQPVKFD